MQWDKWISTLNNFKYAVHLNPNTIGGTFHLNCAYLGIPCIGNIDTNTQKFCFPDLSVKSNDLKLSKKLAKKLRNDEDFYIHCSNKARELYLEHFCESVYKNKWNIIKEKIS